MCENSCTISQLSCWYIWTKKRDCSGYLGRIFISQLANWCAWLSRSIQGWYGGHAISIQTRILEADSIHKNKRWWTRKVLVGNVTKAIYETLLGAVLFYDKLKGILVDIDFKMNDYDECTFMKMINDKQCIIIESSAARRAGQDY